MKRARDTSARRSSGTLVVASLQSLGASLACVDNRGRTPLLHALDAGQVDLAKALFIQAAPGIRGLSDYYLFGNTGRRSFTTFISIMLSEDNLFLSMLTARGFVMGFGDTVTTATKLGIPARNLNHMTSICVCGL